MVDVQDDSDLGVGNIGADYRYRHTVRQEQVVRYLQRGREIPHSRRVEADPMSQKGENGRLIVGRPALHTVAQCLCNDIGVLSESIHHSALAPAAFAFQRPGIVPVVQCCQRCNTGLQQTVYQT